MKPTINRQRTVDAPASVVWDVMTDHDLYAEAAPNLTHVEVVEGEADTMVRRCVDTDGNEWTEACTRWEPGQAFAVQVDVEHSDFHRRLFSRFEGEWSLAETDDGTEMTIAFDYDTRLGPLGRVVSWYLKRKAPDMIEAIFDRWVDAITARQGATDPDREPATPDQPARRTNALYP